VANVLIPLDFHSILSLCWWAACCLLRAACWLLLMLLLRARYDACRSRRGAGLAAALLGLAHCFDPSRRPAARCCAAAALLRCCLLLLRRVAACPPSVCGILGGSSGGAGGSGALVVAVVVVVVVVVLLLLRCSPAEQLPLAAGQHQHQHQHQHESCKGSYGAEQLLWRVASRGDRWFWCGCCVIASRACAL
jgi:hypothetical protein